MASVEFLNVEKSYGDQLIVRGVSLSVTPGEFLVLVGPSGCGKSTCLRMIAGLEEISAGEIRIGGRRVNELPPRDRDIGMVFQSYALYPHMTVRENLGFGLKLGKMPRGGDRGARPGSSEDAGSGAAPAPASAGALRGAATTGRDRPCHRAAAAGVSVRRAAVEPRRCAPRTDTRRRSSRCTSGWVRRWSTSPTIRSKR